MSLSTEQGRGIEVVSFADGATQVFPVPAKAIGVYVTFANACSVSVDSQPGFPYAAAAVTNYIPVVDHSTLTITPTTTTGAGAVMWILSETV